MYNANRETELHALSLQTLRVETTVVKSKVHSKEKIEETHPWQTDDVGPI